MNYSKLILATAILAHTGIASADESADAAYKRGQAALKAGRVHQACEAFETSWKLEARLETELSLAGCYEQDGKPVAAARLYRGTADKDSNASRRQTSLAKATKLEKNAPKLRFAINPMVDKIVIKVDGIEVPSTGDVLVDVGPHEVIATAPGYEGHANAPIDRERVTLDVILRMEPVASPEPAREPTREPMREPMPKAEPAKEPASMPAAEPAPVKELPMTESGSTSHRKRNGIIAGAAGIGLGVGAAIVLTMSSNKFDDERALCPNSQCANTTDLATARDMLSSGRRLRGVGIGMGVGGAVLLGVGAYLLLSPDKQEQRMSFYVEPGGAGATYTARF